MNPSGVGGASPAVVIIELDGGGHRLWYVRMILEAAGNVVGSDHVVVLTTPAARARDEWQVHLGDVLPDDRVALVEESGDEGDVMLNALTQAADLDAFVVVPDGDRYLSSVRKWPRRLRGSLLVVRAHPQPGVGGRFRNLVKLRLIDAARRRTPGMRILSLEMTRGTQDAAMTRRDVPVALDPVRFTPHAVDAISWLSQHDVPLTHPTALVIGDLSERKFVPEILRAWSESDSAVTLILVGRPTAGVRSSVDALVARAQARQADDAPGIVARFEACSDEDFDTWIASVDVVFAMHRNPGASGVTLKGWSAGVPIVVNASPLTERVCRELSIDALVVENHRGALHEVFHSIAARRHRHTGRHAPVRDGHEVPVAMLGGLNAESDS